MYTEKLCGKTLSCLGASLPTTLPLTDGKKNLDCGLMPPAFATRLIPLGLCLYYILYYILYTTYYIPYTI